MEIARGRGPVPPLASAPRRLAVGAEPQTVFAASVRKLAKIGIGRSRFRDVQQSAQNSARAAASDQAPSSGIAR